MNINKVIHEAMGLSPREVVNNVFEYPDYTSPVAYCELMDWMRKNKNDRAMRFDVWMQKKGYCTDTEDWLMLSLPSHVSLIAEWIESEGK